jgi:FixJ family two-component response regulator
MSGLALQERLRDEGLAIPVIMVTGLQAQVQARALAGGALFCLRKPFCERELLSALKRALATRRAR